MAEGMKNIARGFQDQFKKDEGVIEDVSNLHESNIDRTDTEVDKIKH